MRYTLWKIKSHKQFAAVKHLKADNEKFRFKPPAIADVADLFCLFLFQFVNEFVQFA